ncbi:hypothetical protein [Pseudacidovorax sp. RU35E]|jgi:hypothetical protein|uniref:hypothetical protein n=1 Tax=Pseudacidovorax sp. RU35E TaxID=1907403 RepID=UPI000954074E|nr:hypothetical protein [Pseudacidovorax sp. RU35E]SIP95847.1 hypothetical protein SAMN05880557_101288 [Pseudacidovorax sp. RU35E]
MAVDSIPLVLTGTITPRSILTAYANPTQRRNEYLLALRYYSEHAQVYFVENSGYQLNEDADFTSIPNCKLIELAPSDEFDKGKGFQEFLMLDNWIDQFGQNHKGFIKITGRYLVQNINKIIHDIQFGKKNKIIIERLASNLGVALTDVFYIATEQYNEHLKGCYKEANDKLGVYIEHVVGIKIRDLLNVEVFPNLPKKAGISGSTGQPLPEGMKKAIQRVIRNSLYPLQPRYRLI